MAVAQTDGKTTTWVFRTPQEKWDQKCIEGVANGSRISVMFWGCFAERQKGGFTALWPDPTRTGKKGITAEIVLDAYKEHLPQMLDKHLD